ncbi:outer membrane protein [Helicobacter suis]|uniref:outer membrane protein n=1 Tax=Helicobacter suis TaxID=104628 RepID=UPI0013D20DE3|nr:outer membrane protein [Helicobacter suis]
MHYFKYSWLLPTFTSFLMAADSNGVFLEGGYQQGKAQVRSTQNGNVQTTTAPLEGFGLQIGYQIFPSRWVGFKIYGFFDYAHTKGISFPNHNPTGNPVDCKINPAGLNPPKTPTGINAPQCQVNVMNILQQMVGSNRPIQPNMLTYGGGGDIVINFINNQMMALGVLGGVQLAGNSWILATPDFGNVALQYAGLDKRPTGFQLLLNVGGRIRILKHSSIEAGIKFPMMRKNPFLQTKNDGSLYIRRLYSWYVNYAFTF